MMACSYGEGGKAKYDLAWHRGGGGQLKNEMMWLVRRKVLKTQNEMM